ncbi:unknown [Prevotella sp. CAG:5226]|nr:unknown [Prevotella sp. CAG:5226]
MSSLHQASALMYLTGWAESPASAYVKNHGTNLMFLCFRVSDKSQNSWDASL